jgi:aminocarboxymuconate-semialdehyde decarboxylase
MKVDIHSHVMPAAYVEALRAPDNPYRARLVEKAGKPAAIALDSGMTYELTEPLVDPTAKVRELDRLGFDLAAVAPPLTIFHYDLSGRAMLDHVRLVNDGMAEVQRDFPDRFAAMAMLPLQDPDAAVRELDRAIDELGLRAAIICTNVNGTNLDDPSLRPVFRHAAERRVLLFVHAWFVAGADRLPRYHLLNAIGNPLEATIAIGSIIFSGMLDELPELRICIAHGGGAIPSVIGRIDRAYRIRPESQVIPTPPSSYLSRLYYDTVVHRPDALEHLARVVGSDRLLVGSDCPYHLDDMGDPDPLSIVTQLDIPERARAAILGDTALELLRIH